MQFTKHETRIIRAAMPYIKDYPVIKHIIHGNLCYQVTNNDAINAYHKEAVLYSLIVGYAQLFFAGRVVIDYRGKPAKEFAEFLKPYLDNRFDWGMLEAVNEPIPEE